jgi:hypothetical protein
MAQKMKKLHFGKQFLGTAPHVRLTQSFIHY